MRIARIIAVMIAITLIGCKTSVGPDPWIQRSTDASAPYNKSRLVLVASIFPDTWLRRIEKRLDNKPPSVTVLAQSPKGNLLAWGDEDGNVFLWSIADNDCVVVNETSVGKPPAWEPEFPLPGIIAIRFIDDAALHWMTDEGIVWQANIRGTHVKNKKRINQKGMGFSGAILERSFIDVHSRRDLWITNEYVLEKYGLNTGKLETTCKIYPMKKGLYHYVEAMAVSRDGKLLAIASECNAGIVRMKDFSLIRTLNIEYGKKLAFSPDASLLAIATIRHELVVYDTATGKVMAKVGLSPGRMPPPLAFSSNSVLWFEEGDDLHRLDLATQKTELILRNIYAPSSLLVSNDRRQLFVGYEQGFVRIYKMAAVPTENSGRGIERQIP